MGSVARPVFRPPGQAPAQAGHAVPDEAPRDMDGFLASVERRAFRVAELALGHREDALDAVQDAMIRLQRYRHKPPTEWTPLFWSILRRQVTDRHRRNTLRRRFDSWLGRGDEDEGDPMEALPDPGLDPSGEHLRQRRWQALGQALRQLPRRQRECFLLRELQGLSVAEAAAAMGCSEGSVKTHLSRALAALRGRMEEWQ
jgi:RNA polymerase sigma-70 factor (ECF subfamily)